MERLKPALLKLSRGFTLDRAEAADAFDAVMTGEAEPAQLGALLAMIQLRGPSIDELVGAASVMRAKVVPVETPQGLRVIDTCGTGGDGAETFNISTAAAIVAAAAGRPRGVAVAKHGNRAVSSRSGSSQVLEALGVRLTGKPAILTQCLAELGLCFCFAPAHHPAMKHAAPVRQQLGFRTLFNLVGPLTNPAGARHQLLGVFDEALCDPLAQVLLELGTQSAMVVHGRLGGGALDELSTAGPTVVTELRGGTLRKWTLDPASLGLTPIQPKDLAAQGPEDSAAIIRRSLRGERSPAREIIALNAAAALYIADAAPTLAEGLALALAAIDQGAAEQTLQRLVALTQADAS